MHSGRYLPVIFLSRLISSSVSLSTQMTKPKTIRILGYGDSLTAGSSPPLINLFPYGPHLEKKLNSGSYFNTKNVLAQVRWIGLPGWTSSSMVSEIDTSNGLRALLRRVVAATGEKASIVIILAGTNDLGYEVSSDPIINSIKKLHEVAHEEGVSTLAVSIPPSAWQSANDEASKLALQTNEALKEWCNGCSMAYYASFPINAHKGSNDPNFAPDGLHFSPDGYKVLGDGLADAVYNVIQSYDEN